MIRLSPKRAALAFALAAACTFAQAATPATPAMPDVATDPAGAWAWMFEHTDYKTVFPAYDVLEKVGYNTDAAQAEGCRKYATELQDAVAKAPVSIALRRAAMLCAEAVGDDAAAERALVPLAALSKFALSGVTDNPQGAPIRVLRHNDIYALMRTMGLEWKYEYYESHHMTRTFPLVVAAWDPQKKVERHLRFDWLDASVRMVRNAPESRYPHFRSEAADLGVQINAKANVASALDLVAWRESRVAGATEKRIERLRQGTLAGGVQSPHVWLLVCALNADYKPCGDGYVDAVLPLAEQKFALPMTLLAYAYNEGIGVPKDAAAGKRLLDAADQRWDRKGASAYYANLWRDAHLNKVPLPADIAARVEGAVAAGNESAKWTQMIDRHLLDAKVVPDAAEIALLSSKPQNGAGQGFGTLATIADSNDRDDEAVAYWRRAAELGDPASQSRMGYYLKYGKNGVAKDETAGDAMFVRAAQGADNWSARQLASAAFARNDYEQAWHWLRDPVTNDDIEALIWTATMLIDGHPGPVGKPADGLALLRSLGEGGSAVANRQLAQVLIDGRGGIAKDLPEARRLLTIDADKGDNDSGTLLGGYLLRGTLGNVDEAEGTQRLERSIANKDAIAVDGLAFWLFYTKQTPDARKRALELWRAGMAYDDASDLANNYAWALCTIDDPAFRDGKTGLAVSAKIEDPNFGQDDTIAACQAAAGDFAAAKAKQQKVIDDYLAFLAKERATGAEGVTKELQAARDKQLATFKERLALYAAGKDYRTSKQ